MLLHSSSRLIVAKPRRGQGPLVLQARGIPRGDQMGRKDPCPRLRGRCPNLLPRKLPRKLSQKVGSLNCLMNRLVGDVDLGFTYSDGEMACFATTKQLRDILPTT